MSDPACDESVVLVLQAGSACWFRWQGGMAPEHFIEPLDSSGLDLASRCPWLSTDDGAPLLAVRLLLDSPQDEVERVQAAHLSGSCMGHWQRWLLRRHLRRIHPASRVYSLPPELTPDLFGIVHHQLPVHWQAWLQALQKRPLVFTQAVSATDLLARYALTRPEFRRSTVLIDLPNGTHVRHLLMHHGQPVFMRLTSCDEAGVDSVSAQTLLAQSIEHGRTLLSGRREIPGLLQAQDVGIDTPAGLTAAQILAELCLGKPVQGFRCDGKTLRPMRDKRYRLPWIHPGNHHGATGSPALWKLPAGHRDADAVLGVSNARNRLQRRILYLQRATWLCTWLAAAALLAASVHGISSVRERARMKAEQNRIEDQIDALSATVSALSDRPAMVLRSLERLDTHRANRPLEAEEVMIRIAAALQELPSVMLEYLSWVVMDSDGFDEAAFTTTARVPARTLLWDQYTSPAALRVELAGHVRRVDSLRQQQAALERLAQTLGSLQGISDLVILESPVTASHSSEQPLAKRANFRLSLQMSVS